ncbi:MAG: patatin family protein [Erysipelotrichaceae bacterium]|nr:patatin family protein [Erysipelotrichaceae bacterium]
MSKKIALVLEGGGMRGAYTAGCLSWLLDEGIEFDNAYGISTGAFHLSSFLMKSKDFLYRLSTDIIADDTVVGIKPLLSEGTIVGYNYLFDHHLKDVLGYDITDLIGKTDCNAKYGVYDLGKGETVYLPLEKMNMRLLKACCSLPIIGHIVKEDGREYLDGGVTKMIPIEEAVADGCTDCLIITTKPLDYVRKPAKKFVVWLMSVVYRNCPSIARDYEERHINYRKQIDLVKKMEKEGHVYYRYPSRTVNVSRLKGDKADLRELYEMGRADMEAGRDAIMKLLK